MINHILWGGRRDWTNWISERKEPCSLATQQARSFLWVRGKETCGGEILGETACEVTPLLLSSSERQKEKGRLILSWVVRLNCVDMWVGLFYHPVKGDVRSDWVGAISVVNSQKHRHTNTGRHTVTWCALNGVHIVNKQLLMFKTSK